jgi:UDP:flavonoid glycosyltransferase YjiC (YdhE family)
MSDPSVLFYVSGHGYGHARRMSQVIASLRSIAPQIDIDVRTRAPARIFQGILPVDAIASTDIDAGAAERSTLEIDPQGTLDRIAGVFARRDQIVAGELEAIRTLRPTLLVSDIPFLAGDVAEAATIPCIGVSNFTWDWIAEPLVASVPGRAQLIAEMSRSYAKFAMLLRLPLGGVLEVFPRIEDAPMVANVSMRDPAEILRHLQIDPADGRRRALFSLRGAVPTQALAAAAAEATDFLLLCPTNEPGALPSGVVPVPLHDLARGNLDFSDVLRVTDVAVGKLGYGLVAECIASGVSLLWPRRTGFREDVVVEREGPRVMRLHELPLADFHEGRWAEHLRTAAALPPPPQKMPTNGAEVCARRIAELAM